MSQALLSTGALKFDLLYVILPNVFEERQRRLVSSEKTLVTYLQVIIKASLSTSVHHSPTNGETQYISKVETSRALHRSIENCLSSLAKGAKTGLCAETIKGLKVLLHLIIPSYAANFPVTEDFTGNDARISNIQSMLHMLCRKKMTFRNLQTQGKDRYVTPKIS